MNYKKFLFLSFLIFGSAIHAKIMANDNQSYKIVSYYENWSQWRPDKGKAYPHQMDPFKVTHMAYAFASFNFKGPGISGPGKHVVTGDWKVYPVEWTDLNEVDDKSGQHIAPALYNQCNGYDQAQLDKYQMKSLKQINPELQTIISIGGWNFCNPNDDIYSGKYTYKFFSEMVANPEYRQAFIQSIHDFMTQYHFDGVDLDWEYPASDQHGGTANDYQNYLIFLKELRAFINHSESSFTITIASAPSVPSGTVKGTYTTVGGSERSVDPSNPATYFAWLQECSQYLDWLNIMCYDYYGPWPGQGVTYPNAPVVENSADLSSVEKTIQYYLDAKIDPKKVVIGIPSYGRTYAGVDYSDGSYGPGHTFTGPDVPGKYTGEAGLLAYYEIIEQIGVLGWLIGDFDKASETPYAYNVSGKRWVSYDNQDSIAAKASLIRSYNLGGAMLWSFDNDDFNAGFPLLTKINEELRD